MILNRRCLVGARALRLAAGGLAVVLGACEGPGISGPDPSTGDGEFKTPDFVGDASGPFPGFFGGDASFGGLSPGADAGAPPEPLRLELRTAANSPPPISGGTLSLRADGQVAVAGDSDRDAVYVVQIASRESRKVTLAKGSEPGRVVFDRAGFAHVLLRGSGKLAHIDTNLVAPAVETTVCPQPRGLAYVAAGNELLVACMDGQLVSLDASTHAERGRHFVDYDLRDIVIAGGKPLVSRYRSAELLSLDSAGATTARSQPATAQSFGGGGLAFDKLTPDGGSGVDPSPFISLTPTLAWRTTTGASAVWMLHQRSQVNEVAATVGGYGGGCTSITQAAVSKFDGSGQAVGSLPVSLAGLSVDVAASNDGQWLAVASPGGFLQGRGTLQLYATQSLTSDTSAGSCASPVATSLGTSQTVAVAFDAAGVLYGFSREPAQLEIFSVQAAQLPSGFTGLPLVAPLPFSLPPTMSLLATVALDLQSVRDTGHDMFHTDVGGGLSCASCHGEALDDGHVWNFQDIGPRRTQNMRGGIMATAPFHWDGDMSSFGHLVDDVMTGRMGGFVVTAQYESALGQWIDRQPALRMEAADVEAVARGELLFASAETLCSSCHSGPAFTNNMWADVGTGSEFQVPQLRGLGLRAPYMHDGCAATLADRFTPSCGGGDKHGKTSQLSAAQLADLIAYLQTL